MKRIKKVSVTPLSDTAGSIIDSLYSGSNEVTNAPSIRAVKAALGQTFYATTASGSGSSYRYYTITDASLPAEPVNGMTIKVTFPATHSAYLVHLRLNSGTYHQCLTQDVTGASGVGSYPYITTNRVYELVYYNNSWYFLSAFSRIKSQNIDFASSTSHIRLGSVNICWGKNTVFVGGGAYAEGYSEFNLPVTYLNKPTAVVSIHDMEGAVGEYAAVGMVSTSKLGVWCGHVRSTSAGNVEFEWLTIGV